MSSALLTLPRVSTSGKNYRYQRWQGERLLPKDGYLAFDTETEVVDLNCQIPRLALVSVSAGEDANYLIHPDDVPDFIRKHKNLHFICHNTAFDFWVVAQHLKQLGHKDVLQAWWNIVDQNRLHDSMLLDMLVRLADNDSFPDPRDLGIAARVYAGLEVDKNDPYRMRYGEIIDQDWSMVEEGFFNYAVKDAIVTKPTYMAIRKRARELVQQFGTYNTDIHPEARQKFGLLTGAIQAKKAIALAQITRDGMSLDQEWLQKAEFDLRNRLDQAIGRVRELCPDLYKTNKSGNLIYKGTSQTPSKSNVALIVQLEKIVIEVKADSGIELVIPRTNITHKLSTARKLWQEYQDYHPFLRDWIEVEELSKLLQFFKHLKEEKIHPHYSTMVRTGRTSCSSPNIQQIPRDSTFRQAFVASEGYFLLAVDYSFIELCTLAAHAVQRYSQSDLAEVIKSGADPHAHTAAMMLGVSREEFMSWKGNETEVEGQKLKDKFDNARQAAKAINFGLPGGLGAARLQEYAKNTYKIDLTLEEAQQRREVLTKQIYKELDLYLSEDGPAILARNLQAPIWEVRNELGDTWLSTIRKVLAGNPTKKDGKPYQATFVSRIWASLAGLNRNPKLADQLQNRLPSEALASKVCHAGVANLSSNGNYDVTGRQACG